MIEMSATNKIELNIDGKTFNMTRFEVQKLIKILQESLGAELAIDTTRIATPDHKGVPNPQGGVNWNPVPGSNDYTLCSNRVTCSNDKASY